VICLLQFQCNSRPKSASPALGVRQMRPLRALILRLVEPLRRWSWRELTLGRHLGISIVGASIDTASQRELLQRTIEALNLLQQSDQRRLRRVQTYLKHIVHDELPGPLAKFDGRAEACYVDFARFQFDRAPASMVWAYAAILVHESTHGRIERSRIPYDATHRARIERLCEAEAVRFLRRHSQQAAEAWHRIAAKPGRHVAIWRMTGWQRVLAVWKRKSGLSRATNKPRQATADPRLDSDWPRWYCDPETKARARH